MNEFVQCNGNSSKTIVNLRTGLTMDPGFGTRGPCTDGPQLHARSRTSVQRSNPTRAEQGGPVNANPSRSALGRDARPCTLKILGEYPKLPSSWCAITPGSPANQPPKKGSGLGFPLRLPPLTKRRQHSATPPVPPSSERSARRGEEQEAAGLPPPAHHQAYSAPRCHG